MKRIRWTSATPFQKASLIALGAAQVGLFAAAWSDLNRRSPEQLTGSRAAWRAALFLNVAGPLAYFLRGRVPSRWSERDLPDLLGQVVIVTGANSGLGLETTRALAEKGATVIMACRDLQKAERAAAGLLSGDGSGQVVVMALDLADLESVKHFTEAFLARFDRLDLLVNNAGIMVPPQGTTAQGFESQFGVNHLGHFALTAQLIERLNATPGARVVTVSSIAHRFGQIDFTDLNWRRRPYRAMAAYGQSKLANLLFTRELQRRLAEAGHGTLAVAAHPGWASTGLQGSGRGMTLANRLLAQSAQMGALPTLYAAAASGVKGAAFYGPSGFAELGGAPAQVESSGAAHQNEVARQLWTVSEELTGVRFTASSSEDLTWRRSGC